MESAIDTDTGFGASSLHEVQAFNVYCTSSSAGMGISSCHSRDSSRMKEGSFPSNTSAAGAKFSTAASSTSSRSKRASELDGTVGASLHTSLHARNVHSDPLQYSMN